MAIVTDKLKILLVGGFPYVIPEDLAERMDYHHVSQDERTIAHSLFPEAQAVVIIRKFCSHMLSDRAKSIAKSRKIPFVAARTPNFIITELVRYGLLSDGESPPQEQPKAAETAKKSDEPVHSGETKIGLTLDKLRENYIDKVIESVRKIVKPGEKIHEDDLIELLATDDATGLPTDDVRELLPDLAVNGVIYNTTGKTWKMPPADGTLYEFDEDEAAEVPRILEAPTTNVKDGRNLNAANVRLKKSLVSWVELLQGIPEGPYHTQRSIWITALEYDEFVKSNGEKPSEAYYWKVIPEAIKYGVVYRKDGRYYVKTDPEIVLTRSATSSPATSAGSGAVSAPKKPKSPARSGLTPTNAASSPSKKKWLDVTLGSLAAKYKIHIPQLDVPKYIVTSAKKLLTEEYWDECAARTMARLLRNRFYETYLKDKKGFSEDEWDQLAWDTLRLMPCGPVLAAILGKEGFR